MYINEIYFGFLQTLGDFEGLGETCLEINVLYILYITKRCKPRNTSNDPKFKMLEYLLLNFRNDKREFQMTFNERLKTEMVNNKSLYKTLLL